MQTLEKHVVKFGVLTTVGLIGLFLAMKMAGLLQVTELRLLNAIIMFSGIFLSIKTYRDGEFKVRFNYLSGIATGFLTGLVTAILFSIFVGIYVNINPVFLASIVAENPQKDFLNPLTSAMVIFIEAIASGFLFSYASMQYLKQDKSISISNSAKIQ